MIRDRCPPARHRFPLALIATFLVTQSLLPTVGVAGAWLVAAAITLTDADLGRPRCSTRWCPRVRRAQRRKRAERRTRHPIVLLALAALAVEEDASQPTILQVGLIPVGLALASAIIVGLLAAWLLDRSRIHHLSGARGRAGGHPGSAGLPVRLAEITGANAFIASSSADWCSALEHDTR